MAKSIFERLGGEYEQQGDYLIPRLTVPAEEDRSIGIWGRRHLDYLKQYRKVTYTNLLTSGKLNAYLADINEQAQERSHRLIEDMKQAQGITEQLKAENALEWTGKVNNISAPIILAVYKVFWFLLPYGTPPLVGGIAMPERLNKHSPNLFQVWGVFIACK